MALNLSLTTTVSASPSSTHSNVAEAGGVEASNTAAAKADFAQLYAQEQSYQQAKPSSKLSAHQEAQKQNSQANSVQPADGPVESQQTAEQSEQDQLSEASQENPSDTMQDVEPLLISMGADLVPPNPAAATPALNLNLNLNQGTEGEDVEADSLPTELDFAAQLALESSDPDAELQKLGAGLMPFMAEETLNPQSTQQKFATLMQKLALKQNNAAVGLDSEPLVKTLEDDLEAPALLPQYRELISVGLAQSEAGSTQSFSDTLTGQWGQTEGASGKGGTQSAQSPVPGASVALRQPGWSQAVVDRVLWMSSQNIQAAEINLEPAELGRLAVRIDMTGDQAQVVFISGQAGVREALESQLPRLRELFNQQGLNLADVNVASQFAGKGKGEQDAQRTQQASSLDSEVDTASTLVSSGHSIIGGQKRLVDYYA